MESQFIGSAPALMRVGFVVLNKTILGAYFIKSIQIVISPQGQSFKNHWVIN
jgi:hypothetical protein